MRSTVISCTGEKAEAGEELEGKGQMCYLELAESLF